MAKRIVILGSSGFIGGWLLKRFLSNKEYQALGFSSKECDLLNFNMIKEKLSFIEPQDILIMASAISRLTENSFDSMLKNITMAENLSRFIENSPIKQLIFLSSIDIYGSKNTTKKIKENFLPNPEDYYSLSKLVSEFLFTKLCSKKKIPLCIIRLSGVYGPGDSEKSTINQLVTSALKGRITLFNKGLQQRDFVYVDDVYRLLIKILKKEKQLVVNLATGTSYTIAEIAELIQSLVSKELIIEYALSRQTDIRAQKLAFDTASLQEHFPDLKLTTLPHGLSLYIQERQNLSQCIKA